MFRATLHPTASHFFPSVASCDAERQKDQWPPTNMVQRWILEEHTSSFPRKRHDSRGISALLSVDDFRIIIL